MKLRIMALVLAAAAVSHCKAAGKQVDGEVVYRDNCTRCHIAFQSIPARALPAIVHHMQVRALLTREEQKAVLEYLMETADSTSRQRNPQQKAKKP